MARVRFAGVAVAAIVAGACGGTEVTRAADAGLDSTGEAALDAARDSAVDASIDSAGDSARDAHDAADVADVADSKPEDSTSEVPVDGGSADSAGPPMFPCSSPDGSFCSAGYTEGVCYGGSCCTGCIDQGGAC